MEKIEKLFFALSDKTRLRIVRILLDYPEICVCQFQNIFKVSQPKISFHLRILRDAGIIQGQKKGRWTYYHLGDIPECFLDLIKELPSESINQHCEVGYEKD